MPKSPVTREHADKVGRIAVKAGADGARFIARIVGQLGRTIESVPPTVRLLILTGVLMLLGIVGAIASPDALGLMCIVVVIPVCSMILGALGHRWYSGLGDQHQPGAVGQAGEIPVSDLQRSVEYVDKKLTFALSSFGAERHQHAMIALFQAKTAVELTLGTEPDAAGSVEALLSVDDRNARPRIRVGAASASPLREGNTLAAS